MKSPISRILLERHEGYIGSVMPTAEVVSFTKATEILRSWAETAPTEGYDKAAVEIQWQNGKKHRFRVEMQHPSASELPDVSLELRFEIDLVLGRYRDPDWTDIQHKRLLQHYRDFGHDEHIADIEGNCMTQD